MIEVNGKTYSKEVLEEALELYQVVINYPVTVDMLRLVGERCREYGYSYDRLDRKLTPYWVLLNKIFDEENN